MRRALACVGGLLVVRQLAAGVGNSEHSTGATVFSGGRRLQGVLAIMGQHPPDWAVYAL